MEREKYQTMEVVEAAKEPCAKGTKEEYCKPENIRTVRCKVCGYERKDILYIEKLSQYYSCTDGICPYGCKLPDIKKIAIMEVIQPGIPPSGQSTFRCRVCGLEAKRGFCDGQYDRRFSGTPWKCKNGCKLSKEERKRIKEGEPVKPVAESVEEPTGPIPVPVLDVSYRPVSDLKVHPLNADIYGNEDKDFNDFLKSVRTKGINSPLIITKNNVIVSGHRRYLAAKALSISEVPVTIYGSDDSLDIEEQLLDLNKYRELTQIQKTKTFLHYKKIEEERAKRRMEERPRDEGGKFSTVDTAEGNGKSRDKAAKKVGLSGKTMEDSAKVLDKIEELKKEGKTEEAKKIEKILNGKSVNGAVKAIKKLEEKENGGTPKENQTKVKKTSYISHPAYWQAYIDEDTYARAYTALTEEGKKKITIFSKLPVEVNAVLTNAEGYPIEEMAAQR